MTSDDVIETAARALLSWRGEPTWDEASELIRQGCLNGARTLAKAGLLVDEVPTPALPFGQVRADPEMGTAYQKASGGRWWGLGDRPSLADDDVRDWAVLVPETNVDELSAERDRLADKVDSLRSDLSRSRLRGANQASEITRLLARVAELEAAEGCAVDADALARAMDDARYAWFKGRGDATTLVQAFADAIRENLPAATAQGAVGREQEAGPAIRGMGAMSDTRRS